MITRLTLPSALSLFLFISQSIQGKSSDLGEEEVHHLAVVSTLGVFSLIQWVDEMSSFGSMESSCWELVYLREFGCCSHFIFQRLLG